MKFEPEIRTLSTKTLVGVSNRQSLHNIAMRELWARFMPACMVIHKGVRPAELFSITQYPSDYFSAFHPAKTFTKWAAMEWLSEEIPEGMESVQIPEGTYAVIHYKGSSANTSVFEFMFREWLPASGYELDDRPHFEILGERYKNNDPDSEEELWFPVRKR